MSGKLLSCSWGLLIIKVLVCNIIFFAGETLAAQDTSAGNEAASEKDV